MKKLLVFALVLAATAVFGLVQLNTNATSKYRDCDANAIMYCGAYSKDEFTKKLNSGDKKHSSKDLKAVYKHYGVDTSLKGAKNGVVTSSGKVIVNGKTVATDAWSVGRHKIGNSSKKVSAGGVTTYTRATSVSFVGGSLDAWVMFNADGTFKNAVLKACGNPIGGKNKVPKKSATCDNLTAKKISRTKFEFTGKASVKNGAKVTGYTFDFGDGKKTTVKTSAKSKTVSHEYAKPGNYKVKVTANTDQGAKNSSNCATTVKVEQPPKPPKVELPVVSCDALEVKKNSRTSYDFTAKATAKNTKVTAYTFDFGDGNKKTVKTDATTKTVSHDYAKEGKYTVQVTLTTLDKQVVDKKCSAVVDVAKAPVATCDGLDAKVTDRTHYELAAKASAKNGASIKDYSFVITDENGKTVVNKTTSKATISGELAPGKYTAKVTVHTSEGDRSGENCATEFTIVKPTEIQVCDLDTKKVITIDEKDFDETKHSKNLEDCKEVPTKIEVCDLDTKKVVTIDEKDFDKSKHSKNLEDCKEVVEKTKVCDTTTGKVVTVDEKDLNDSRYSKDLTDCETPEELPQTGAGTGISAALGLGSIATAVTYYVASRRNLLSSLLGR